MKQMQEIIYWVNRLSAEGERISFNFDENQAILPKKIADLLTSAEQKKLKEYLMDRYLADDASQVLKTKKGHHYFCIDETIAAEIFHNCSPYCYICGKSFMEQGQHTCFLIPVLGHIECEMCFLPFWEGLSMYPFRLHLKSKKIEKLVSDIYATEIKKTRYYHEHY